ncbi:hypothetical protein [Ewingella americana]|uniref:hypothetical protein n=1 Tax=Ewingella americana TaxID=41202 RepID=UPI001F1AE424|nr:hypothetical protein [Ewingella americana]
MSNQSGQRPFILFGFMMNVVGHISAGLWRHPEDQAHRYTDIHYWVEIAKLLDDAGFDALFIADALGQLDVYQQQPNAALRHAAQMPVNDPMLLVSAMGRLLATWGSASRSLPPMSSLTCWRANSPPSTI